MKKIVIFLFMMGIAQSCFGQSKPLDLSVTLSDLNNYQVRSEKGIPNGYASLGSNGLVIPSLLFPGFSSSQDGTIWSKSGSSWLAISNFTVQPFSLVVSLTRIGKLSPQGISSDIYGIGTELSTTPLTLYGGNSRVYIASGQTLGGANVNFDAFTWSINSSGNFDLNSGVIKGGLSLNNTSISNISSIFASSGLSINFTNNRITSLQSGKDIVFAGDNFGVQVPNISTNNLLNSLTSETTKSYALNVRSADLLYVTKNSSNTWALPQNFTAGISVSPAISIVNGGTGATNALQARQNLGITTGVIGGFQAWSPVLSSIASNVPTTNNFLVGVSAAWVSRTPAQVRGILGLEVGVGGLQPYSEALNYISTIVTNNTFGSKYLFVGDPISKTISARTVALVRSDLGLEINSTNGVQAYSIYLRDIANLGVPQLDEFLVGNGTTWTKKAPSQARIGLGLGATWLTNTNVTNFRSAIGLGTAATNDSSSFQPASSNLNNLALNNAINLTNFPLLNQNTTGTASNVTGVVSVVNGGTGATNQSDARTALGLGNGFTGTKTFITTDNVTNTVVISNGIITSWTP